MAAPTGTMITPTLAAGVGSTGSGIREDLSDVITNISPHETPFLSGFGTASARQTKHEWLEDALAAPAANAHLEGTDATNDTLVARTRLNNECQILRKTVQVSATASAVNVAGLDDEYAYQTQKSLKELGLDIERALILGARVARSASVAGVFGGIKEGITTEATSLSGAAFTEDALNDAIQGAWENGGDVTKAFVSATLKRAISGFTGPATNYRKQEVTGDRRIINTVDVYESDFGTVQIIPHRLISHSGTASANYMFVLDMKRWAIAWLRRIKHDPLAKLGSSKRGMLECEITLERKAEKANAKVTNFRFVTS